MRLSKLNYTGIFLKDGTHMTFNYGLPLEYPKDIKSGDKAILKVVGEYSDDQVSCLVVEWNGIKKQPSGTLLHITTKVQNGGKPVQSGQRATKNGYNKITPYKLNGVWR